MPDAVQPKPLLTPPDSAIRAGYYLSRARNAAKEVAEYLIEARDAVIQATPDVAKQSGMYLMEPEPGLKLIGDALAGTHLPGVAHDNLRRLLKERGYRDITLDDFKKYGGGGDR